MSECGARPAVVLAADCKALYPLPINNEGNFVTLATYLTIVFCYNIIQFIIVCRIENV